MQIHSIQLFASWMQVGRDPRPVMRDAYNMFKDRGDPEKVEPVIQLQMFVCCISVKFLTPLLMILMSL